MAALSPQELASYADNDGGSGLEYSDPPEAGVSLYHDDHRSAYTVVGDVDVVVRNVVSTAAIATSAAGNGDGDRGSLLRLVGIDLAALAARARHAEYNPKRFAAVIMRIGALNAEGEPELADVDRKQAKATALVFSSGKLVVTGPHSEAAARAAVEAFFCVIARVAAGAEADGVPLLNGPVDAITLTAFRRQNVVASGDVGSPVDLPSLAEIIGAEASDYNPELFPGLIWRQRERRLDGGPEVNNGVALIFCSGKIVFTGAKSVASLRRQALRVVGMLDLVAGLTCPLPQLLRVPLDALALASCAVLDRRERAGAAAGSATVSSEPWSGGPGPAAGTSSSPQDRNWPLASTRASFSPTGGSAPTATESQLEREMRLYEDQQRLAEDEQAARIAGTSPYVGGRQAKRRAAYAIAGGARRGGRGRERDDDDHETESWSDS